MKVQLLFQRKIIFLELKRILILLVLRNNIFYELNFKYKSIWFSKKSYFPWTLYNWFWKRKFSLYFTWKWNSKLIFKRKMILLGFNIQKKIFIIFYLMRTFVLEMKNVLSSNQSPTFTWTFIFGLCKSIENP